MGIPGLTTALQRFGAPHILQGDTLVIDGPALAHHILHVCRVNGATQPSYRLVAHATLTWLDELVSRQVNIEAIYFDGCLPSSKRAVRMERILKSSAQLNKLFSNNRHGCPRAQVAADDRTDLADVFQTGVPEVRASMDPSFFVPAVIDGLKHHPRYRNLTHLVPGEADAYCARLVSERGGLALTSDSDLLVYDLRQGQVVFFRDIHRGRDLEILCSKFAPSHICQRLGLPSTTGLLRLAFEQSRAPSASLSKITVVCSQPVSDLPEYRHFCKQYQGEDDATFPVLDTKYASRLTSLDPRVSELAIQLWHSPSSCNGDNSIARIFLPALTESPDRGSAWEQSIPLRQLAYYFLQAESLTPRASIWEYRRVKSVTQKGRQIDMISMFEAQQSIDDILEVMTSIKDMKRVPAGSYWQLVCLAVDMRECQRQAKQSHVGRVLQQRHSPSMARASRVSWDVVHFNAQLQAALYSLRMLRQAALVFLDSTTGSSVPSNTDNLLSALLGFPSLTDFPDIDNTVDFLLSSEQNGLLPELSDAVQLSKPPTSEVGIRAQSAKQEKHPERFGHEPKPRIPGSKFSPLSLD
ncbi:hypothetical protein CDD83_7577 [Cordyceps sp. RAO-2017]|nr:hypothetical protein CDD83_7577 [Cordyceps sp. RAO-2017]